ncbi:MAG: Mu-like prophage major head subunit gpT family protein [Chloroflexi bacterium]|nr:Mu-like prophage major head subunit gpT family protein [Chloroflexota bacterium]
MGDDDSVAAGGVEEKKLRNNPMDGGTGGAGERVFHSLGEETSEGRVLESVEYFGEVLEAAAVPGERAVEVTIIRPGLSANRLEYPEDVLLASVPMWEGVAAFCDHPSWIDQSRAGGRSVRDLVGVYSEPRWDNGIRAKLRFNGQSGWLYDLVCEAIRDREAGKVVAPMGISADMLVFRERLMDRWKVHQVRAVTSADVVFRPSAGGKFERILEGRTELGDEEREQGAGGVAGTATSVAGTARPALVSEAVAAELAAVREARVGLCGVLLEQKLGAAGLPEKAVEQLRGRYAGRVFEGAALDGDIAGMKELLASVTQGSVVRGMGVGGVGRVQTGLTTREQIQLALDRLFGLPVERTDVPRLTGIREAYIALTGDRQFTGRYNWEESLIREADEVTTSIMNEVVANTLNRRLVMDYKGQAMWWRPFVSVSSIKDMRTQTRVLLNDFAALATVNENGAYANLAWGDSAETYTPTKRGNLVTITLEMIMNDDIRAVARIAGKLAVAAAITVNEFVSGLFTANAGTGSTMADTNAVFNAAHGSNTGVTALSSAALQAAITVVMKHANSASKRLGIVPRWLLIPPDLLWTARTILESSGLPGTANNDVNVTRGVADIIVVPNWTDANNWYLMPDPAVAETIELGFLNGREEPELLMQDNPSDGAVFTNDALAYKVRHIYGGGWLDWRGTYGSVVA